MIANCRKRNEILFYASCSWIDNKDVKNVTEGRERNKKNRALITLWLKFKTFVEEPFSKWTHNMNNTIMIHDNNRNTVQTGKNMFERPYHSNLGNMSHLWCVWSSKISHKGNGLQFNYRNGMYINPFSEVDGDSDAGVGRLGVEDLPTPLDASRWM